MNDEATITTVTESTVLEKFDGEPVPENLIERIYIENGEVVKVETLGDEKAKEV